MKQTKKQNHIPIILVTMAALFFLGGAGWYLYQQSQAKTNQPNQNQTNQRKTQAETAPQGWLKYHNETHHFTFFYPPEWKLSEIRNNDKSLILGINLEDESQTKIEVYGEEMTASYNINIHVEDNPQQMSAENLYLDMFTQSSREKAKEDIEKIIVNGLEGIRFPEMAAPSSGPAYGVLFAQGDRAYRLIYSALTHQETHEKYLPAFEQLVQSVRIE